MVAMLTAKKDLECVFTVYTCIGSYTKVSSQHLCEVSVYSGPDQVYMIQIRSTALYICYIFTDQSNQMQMSVKKILRSG